MARKQPPRVRTPTPPNGNAAPRKPPLPAASPASGMFPGALVAPIALPGAALCLLVAVSYFPALSAGFVWDDVILTRTAPLHTWSGLAQVWFAPRGLIQDETHYWPLLYTLFWLEHKLWGLAPLGYHLVNLLLHTGVVLLLWRLLRRLDVPGAWFAAAVFAVHPLHVESVAWVIGRKDILATVFYLSSVLAYIRFTEMPRGRRGGHYLLAVALFVLGLLSKSIAITLPVALLLWHWWQHGRVTLTDGSRTLPFFLVGLGIGLADYAYSTSLESVAFAYTLLERGLIAAHALTFYAGKLLWPVGLIGIYPHWEPGIGDALAWGGVVGFAAVVAVLWCWRRQLGRGPLAGVLFFAVALSPVLGFVDFGYMQFSFVADRYQYLGGIGLIAVVAGAVGRACQRGLGALPAHRTRPAQLAIGAVGAAILAVAGLLTWNQAGIYRDDGTFFTHVIAHNPQARSAYYNLGTYLETEGRYGEAQAAYETAHELQPDAPAPLNNIGAMLSKQGHKEEAMARYREALRLNPQYPKAMKNLVELLINAGALLSKQGRPEEAAARFREVLRFNPQHQVAMRNMAAVLMNQERHAAALASAQQVIAHYPDDAQAHQLLGALLSKQGRPEEANTHFREALRLNPQHPTAMRDIAGMQMNQGRYAEAHAIYQTALEREPDDPDLRNNIGVLLEKQGRHEEATARYRETLRLNPQHQNAMRNLATLLINAGALLEKQGRPEAAAARFREVLRFNPQHQVAMRNMAAVLMGQGRHAAALAAAQQVIAHYPDDAQAHQLIGALLSKQGRPEEAITHFREVLRLNPQHPTAMRDIAGMQMNQGRYAEGLASAQQAIARASDDVQAHYLAGLGLFHLNRKAEALRHYDRALALDPNLKTAREQRKQFFESMTNEGRQ